MAAIYSGIHLKLKSAQTPWEDKIKLARFAWISSQCLLPNKEQFLLDWCSHALTGWYNKKVEFPQNVLESLWCYFDDLLHSKKLQSYLKQGKSVSLRLNVAQLLLDRLQDHEQSAVVPTVGLSTLLSICQGIFSSSPLSSVFTTKYELMVSLLARLVSLACHHLQQLSESSKSTLRSNSDHESDMDTSLSQPICDTGHEDCQLRSCAFISKFTENLGSTKLFEVLLHALACYSSVQRQQINPNRVFTLVTNQLFQPLIFLRHWLSSDAQLPVPQTMSRDIRNKIDKILQMALFPPELVSLYQEELTKVDSGKRSAGAKGPLRPANVLLDKLTVQSICEPSLYYAVKSNTVSVLFKLFLESYGVGKGSRNEEQGMLCFYFLAALFKALDVGLDLQKLFCKNKEENQKCQSLQSSPCVPESWSLALLSVESLLNNALFGDIYNVAADRIRHEEVQLKFYRAVAEILLKRAQPSIPAWYRCLKTLCSLNHHILEPDLEQLLSLAWVQVDCMDSRVLRAQQVTVCSLLQTYTKLRQLPKFFTDLLSVISDTILDQPQPPLLSHEVSASLRTCLLDSPPSQTVEICSLVLKNFMKLIPQFTPQTMTEGKNYKVRSNQGSSLKMLSLSQVLHSILFSLKTLDNSSPLPLVRQCQKFMQAMHEAVKELEQVLTNVEMQTKTSDDKASKKVKKIQKVVDSETNNASEAALLLRYTWVEIDTLFSIHCSKYTSPDPVHQIASETNNQTCPCPSVLEVVENLLSGERFLQTVSNSPVCSLLQRHILLQQMKKVLSNSSMLVSSSSTALLKRAARFIVAEEETENCLNSDQKWDGEINNVNGSSYLVAHWHLVTSNLPLILPYLDEKDVQRIATVLVGSLLNRTTHNKDTVPNCLTISLISSELIKSQIFPELQSLFSVTVQFLLQRVTRVLMVAQRPKDFAIFQNSTTIQKEIVVESILASLTNADACVALSNAETQEIMNLLQVLEVMNMDGMNSDDLSDCFLVLFFMLTSCQKEPSVNTDETSGSLFLQRLFQLLNCLLEGVNFPQVLKSVHGSILLRAVVSSLLRHKNPSGEQTDWPDLLRRMQAFIKCLIQLIISRSSSVRLNLNQFAAYLCSDEMKSKLTEVSSSSDMAACSGSMLTTNVVLAALSTFSQTLTCNLGKGKSLDELLTQTLRLTTDMLGLGVESVLKPHAVVQKSSVISQAFVVEVVSVMLQCELSLFSIEEDKQAQSIGHMALYRSSSQQILKEIISAPRPREFLVSSLSFLSMFYSAVEKTAEKDITVESEALNDLFISILHTLQRLLTAHWISLSNLSELESAVQTLLCHLVEKCSPERFNQLLLMIKDGLDTGKLRAGNSREVLSTVILIKLLFCCPLPEACFNALWLLAPQIISSITFLVNSSSQDISLNLPFTVPAVTALTALLRQGEGVIANPHHVTVVLGALQCVPLDRLTPAVYESSFTAVHEALFAIIKCHPQVMLKAAPSFLNVFYRLVASIMQEGKQRKDGDTGPDSGVYLRCAMLVERMYSHIAATSEDFTTLSAFIVAQYVTELQKVTLRPDIKLHLTEGIYMILDLCLESDIKFLMAGLQAGVREVFNDLYSGYTHYHKTQRQGEDKYTV